MYKNQRSTSLKNDILFLLMGFFVFSELGSIIILNYLHFPISLPELLLLPFVIILKEKMLSVKFKLNDFVVSIYILLILLAIGLICGRYSLFAMLSSSRAWFYLFIFCFAFSRPNKFTNSDLLWLSIGSLIAWLVESVMNYQTMLVAALDGDSVVTYGLMLAVPIFFSISIYRERYLIMTIGVLLISATVIFSGIRRLLAIAIISLLVALIFKIVKSKKQIFSFVLVGFLVVGAIGITLPMVSDYVKSTSPTMYYRVFEKTEVFFETGGAGNNADRSRLNHFHQFSDEFMDYTIPYGMVSLQTSTDNGAGVFNDFPLYQLCWIFSWPITLLILYHICLLLYRNIRKYVKMNDESSFVSINAIICMLMLLFLEGTYIEYPFATPITGLLLGRAWCSVKTKQIVL